MTSPDAAMSQVIARLYSRRVELERAILARVRDIVPDRPHLEDPEYIFGLRAAIASLVEYALAGVEQGEDWSAPIPSAALHQARRAARVGIRLETVLRRYVAGYALLGDLVMHEADRAGLLGQGIALRRLQRQQAALLDGLMMAITEEYDREVERTGRSPEQRRTEFVLRALAGGHVESAELGYELDAWHLAVIATGTRAEEAVQELAARLHRDVLPVSRGEKTVWAWYGGRKRLGASSVERALSAEWPTTVALAVSEQEKGVEGLRLTHRQAQATLGVVLLRPQRLTMYVDVALLAAVLENEVLARSLVKSYLSPLGSDAVLCRTLREYLASGCSATNTAEALGVVRGTVENRLRTVARALDRELHTCMRELQLALELDELGVSA